MVKSWSWVVFKCPSVVLPKLNLHVWNGWCHVPVVWSLKTRYSKVGRLKTEKEKLSTRWVIGFSSMGQFIIHFHLVHKSKNSWWIIYNYKPLLSWAIPISYTMSYSPLTEVSGKKRLPPNHPSRGLGSFRYKPAIGDPIYGTPQMTTRTYRYCSSIVEGNG